MLALMPQSPPMLDFRGPTPMGNSTMSLALLPSSRVPYNQQSTTTLLPVPAPSKKPKLSLNTSTVNPIFGKASTSLRLETLSATSPTARNTFRNKQSPVRTPSVKARKPTLAPLSTNAAIPAAPILTPSNIELPESADTADFTSAVSATPASTIDSLSSEAPYKLPFNASSILTNGPIPRIRTPRISFAQSRPMFPAPKRVSFSVSLTTDISTTKYTLRHSDIEPTTISLPEQSPAKETTVEKQEEATNAELETTSTTSSQTGDQRESWYDDDDNDTAPVTPVAGRRKKDRQWMWTLGPLSTSS